MAVGQVQAAPTFTPPRAAGDSYEHAWDFSCISERVYPLEKAAFLISHVGGYGSIKICRNDLIVVSRYIKGSTLVITIALV